MRLHANHMIPLQQRGILPLNVMKHEQTLIPDIKELHDNKLPQHIKE